MTRLPTEFREFLKSLNTHGVEYLLVGGYAVGYHGYPRTTADVEFDTCYAKRIEDELDGIRVSIIDLACLRKNKKASGRHKDLDDLEHLPGAAK